MSSLSDKPGGPVSFSLLRHGQTEWNRQKRIQGQSNSPLTETGVGQILSWQQYCHKQGYDRILASDLGRVRQSVAHLNQNLNLPVTFDRRLREQCWGDWEGLESSQITLQYKVVLDREVSRGWAFTPPGGESRLEVLQRAMEALNDVADNGSQNILVVCHLGVIKCLIYAIEKRVFMPNEPKILKKNRLHKIVGSRGSYRIDALNISAETGT